MNGTNRLFTLCFQQATPNLATAAWVAVNASSGDVLSSGNELDH